MIGSRGIGLLLLTALVAGDAAHAAPLPRFPADAVWYQDVSSAPLAADSASRVATWQSANGFGTSGFFSLGFTMYVLQAPPGTPTRPVIDTPTSGYLLPDCDALGTPVPLPAGGAIENSASLNYTCDNANERCRMLVVSGTTLYELREANVTASGIESNCLVTWNLARTYPPQNRGENCLSSSIAGIPTAPLLLNADEMFEALQRPNVADRHLGHALMLHVPSSGLANDIAFNPGTSGRFHVRPASRTGNPTGPAGSVPFGARLRLRPDFPFANYNPAAQVVLRTMQKFGLVVLSGSTAPIMQGERDTYTTHKWSEPGIALAPLVFSSGTGQPPLTPSDFQVVDTGARIASTFNCIRELHVDGFE